MGATQNRAPSRAWGCAACGVETDSLRPGGPRPQRGGELRGTTPDPATSVVRGVFGVHEDLEARLCEHADYACTVGPSFCIGGSAIPFPHGVQTCSALGGGVSGGWVAFLGEAFPTLSFPTYNMQATRGRTVSHAGYSGP